MPHMSPMKWINMFIYMYLLTMMLTIKMNFLTKFYPKKNKLILNTQTLYWKI